MYQVLYCECGESSMLKGRCVGCKRVRPSSNEVKASIVRNGDELRRLEDSLERALKLEAEDNE